MRRRLSSLPFSRRSRVAEDSSIDKALRGERPIPSIVNELGFLVPKGAEERAVRHAASHAAIAAIHAGARAASLPDELPAGLIVVLGLCGALRGLRTGDCAIFRDVVDESGRFTFDEELVASMHARLPSAVLVHGCTVNHVVTRATERAALAAAYSADAVDMEGTHVARALAARGRPAVIVRVASDDATYDLPPIEDAFDANGAIRPLHLALAFGARPRAAARFISDVRRSLRALSGVANALTKVEP